MSKPLKYYQTINQPPRSMKDHGKHRRASAPAYRSSSVGADHGTGGASEDTSVSVITWRATPGTYFTWGNSLPITEPQPPAVPYAGIRTGEIIGHRLWWVIEDGGEQWLCSLAHRRLWKPGETVAGDLDKIVDQDFFGLDRIWGGVYAFAERERVESEIEVANKHMELIAKVKADGIFILHARPSDFAAGFVVGTVKMWGEVIEHETGYRAQFAKLNSIEQLFGEGDLDALRTKYGMAS